MESLNFRFLHIKDEFSQEHFSLIISLEPLVGEEYMEEPRETQEGRGNCFAQAFYIHVQQLHGSCSHSNVGGALWNVGLKKPVTARTS